MNRTTTVRDEIIYLGNDFIQLSGEDVKPPEYQEPPPDHEQPLRDTPPPLIIDPPPQIEENALSDGPQRNANPDQRDEVNDRTADA